MRARLLWGTGVGVTLLFASTGLLVYTLVRESLQDDFDRTLHSKVQALSVLVEQDGDDVETDLEQQLMPEFRPGPSCEYYQLWTGDGDTLARSESLVDNGDLRLDDVALDALLTRFVTLPDGRAGRQVTYAFAPRREESGDASDGRAVLAVARSTAELHGTLARLRRILVAAGLAAACLTLGLLLWIVRFGLRPLEDVAATIATIDHDDLAVRLDATRAPAELVPVVDRLNELLARVEAALARERELSADVAHELRTPLTGLATMMEVALTREREPARYRQVLGECLAICRSTGRMIESLLVLARAEGGHLQVRAAAVSIGPLIAATLAPFGSRIAERGLSVAVDLKDDLTATSDPEKLSMIVSNLIDNAVSYCDEGGRIRIEGRSDDHQTVLVISNTADAIDSIDVTRVFERFWRGDAARAVGDHAGLGLALCLRLAELTNATLEVTTRGGEFVVTLSQPD